METKGSSHEVAHYKFTGTRKTSHYKLKSISSNSISCKCDTHYFKIHEAANYFDTLLGHISSTLSRFFDT
jgi:hypothetical protein